MGADNLSAIVDTITGTKGDLLTVAVAVLGVIAVVFSIKKIYSMIAKG